MKVIKMTYGTNPHFNPGNGDEYLFTNIDFCNTNLKAFIEDEDKETQQLINRRFVEFATTGNITQVQSDILNIQFEWVDVINN